MSAQSTRYRVSLVGASGYVGGELLRLLFDHPAVELKQVTSERAAGRFAHFTHPNLRSRPPIRFSSVDDLEECDILFSALPHGSLMARVESMASRCSFLIDLSADFRLDGPEAYERWYGGPHAAPGWLDRFVYGLPELRRQELRGAHFASGVGCNATTVNLALLPLLKSDTIDWQSGVTADVKVGSSEAGQTPTAGSHHPERAGVMRSFAPVGHRHTAEVEQAVRWLGVETDVAMSVTAVEQVRGVLATCHLRAREGVTERELFRAYRSALAEEPFVRLVKEKTGLYRYPEPKILAGSNYAEVGFAFDEGSRRVVALCALDNLMKGAAGSAVQAMNLMLGLDETTALGFPGLHPS